MFLQKLTSFAICAEGLVIQLDMKHPIFVKRRTTYLQTGTKSRNTIRNPAETRCVTSVQVLKEVDIGAESGSHYALEQGNSLLVCNEQTN